MVGSLIEAAYPEGHADYKLRKSVLSELVRIQDKHLGRSATEKLAEELHPFSFMTGGTPPASSINSR